MNSISTTQPALTSSYAITNTQVTLSNALSSFVKPFVNFSQTVSAKVTSIISLYPSLFAIATTITIVILLVLLYQYIVNEEEKNKIKLAEDAKKLEDAKKAEEAKKAEDTKKTEDAKKQSTFKKLVSNTFSISKFCASKTFDFSKYALSKAVKLGPTALTVICIYQLCYTDFLNISSNNN